MNAFEKMNTVEKLKSSLKISAAIAYYSFLETLRNRFFLGVVLLALPISLSALFLNPYNLGFQVRLVTDAGLTMISTIGLFIVLFFTLDQVVPDIERKTIYFVVTRSASRLVYMLGRFLGICLTLLFLHVFLGSLLLAILKIRTSAWFLEVPVAVFIIFLKQALLVSIVMFLAACSTKIVTVSLSVLIYVLGHGLDIFRMLVDKNGNYFAAHVLDLIAFLLPDFSLFETRIMVMQEIPARGSAIFLLTLYTFSAILFYLSAGGAILRRRDL